MTQKQIIPVARPWLDEREAEAVRRPLLSGWLTQGPEVAAFEREFATAVDAAYAAAVSNCTAALHLALRAVGVGPGDEVVTVSHSFIATANAIRYCGAIPVFVDIERATYNIDPNHIVRVLTPRTRAILCVHQIGMPCDLGTIVPIARQYGIPLIEDAACAIGSEILWDGRWERIGKPHGDIACFSFHPRKVITTGDGGMVTTSRREWDEKIRLWRQHAMSTTDTVRHHSDTVVFESYPELGYNYRMTDVQAAIGRQQLARLPEIIDRRRAIASRYHSRLAEIPGLQLPHEPAWARSNWQSYSVGLPAGADQREVMQALLDRGVATRRGIMCAHRSAAYASEPWSCGSGPGRCECPPPGCRRLVESERAEAHNILLPLFAQMSEDEQDYVATVFAQACRQSIALTT